MARNPLANNRNVLDKLILREKNNYVYDSRSISHCGDGFRRFEVSFFSM